MKNKIIKIIYILILIVIFWYLFQTSNNPPSIDDISFELSDTPIINITVNGLSVQQIREVFINENLVKWEANSKGKQTLLQIPYRWESNKDYHLYLISNTTKIEKTAKSPIINSSINIYNINISVIYKNYSAKTIIFNDLVGLSTGKWKKENSVLSGEGGWVTYFLDNPKWENFIFEGKAKTIPSGEQVIRFLLRFQDDFNFYWISFSSGGMIDFHKTVNSKDSILSSIKFEYQQDKWYIIKIIADGPNFELFLDESKIFDIVDEDPILNGKIGFKIYTHSHFSDISINRINKEKSLLLISYELNSSGLNNISVIPFLLEKPEMPSRAINYIVHDLKAFNDVNKTYSSQNGVLKIADAIQYDNFSFDYFRDPDVIYFQTSEYRKKIYAIRLIARGWDEQKQEWVFKEFMSPEFTWEDVVEGRTITAGGNSTG